MGGETLAGWWCRVRDHWWDRQGAHGVWWIPDEAPGPPGCPELWIDEAALDMYARGDAAPAVTVRFPDDRTGLSMLRAVIRFEAGYDLGTRKILDAPAVDQVVSRRHSRANGGRPYYVCTWPD